MNASLLDRARSGDDAAFAALVAPLRRQLHLHCYRLLGSVTDAEDLLQETMVAAWRGIGGFTGRSSLRTWLYRIATNRCLNAIRDGKRRPPPAPVPPFDPPEPTRRADVTWLQPYPDAWLDPPSGPPAGVEGQEAISLAFLTALQQLPPRQCAVLVLCDVLGFSGAEVAGMLAASPVAVKGLLQRARSSLARAPRPGADADPAAGSAAEVALAGRFAEAYAADDVRGVVALLTDDAWLAMPPAPHEYGGVDAIAGFLRASAEGRSGLRLELVPTRANGQPGFVCALGSPGSAPRPSGVVVLTLAGDRIARITRFLDPRLPALFGEHVGGARWEPT